MLRSNSLLTYAAAVITAATLIAACGSSSHSPTHNSTSGETSINGHLMTVAQANQDMRHFASCMTTHGVQGLPNPVAEPAAFKHALTATAPGFTSAMTACGHLLPGQETDAQGPARTHQQVDAMLSFARCIRGHGFSRFPDPTSGGNLTHEMLAQAGIDLHQPAVVQAADACVHLTHRLLTRADVARFIAGG
jgi:hypothetical protein